MRCFLISTLAEYQTRFWVKVGHALKKRGYGCEFVSFDDRSTAMLRQHGFTAYTFADIATTTETDAAWLTRYGITTPERWFLHERHSYGEQDSATLLHKLSRSLQLAEHAILACKAMHGDVAVVQEVGGFLSVVGCFFAAQRASIPHWFIEPAFFKGRLFFTRDSFGAPLIPTAVNASSLPELQAYLTEALETRRIVIPEKDRHHYSPVLRKILNPHNLRRLVEKSIDKYLLRKNQEFGYLGRQVGMHLRMLVNSYQLRSHYTRLSELDRFIYFPLHVPADMALTLRSPQYVDQLALIEQVLHAMPLSHRLAVKEHPAMIGALDAQRLRRLQKHYPQLAIIDPSTNNYDVLHKADLIISINSKSGAEALLLGKPVIVLGEAFYSACPLVLTLTNVAPLAKHIAGLLESPVVIDPDAITRYFHAVWDASLVGELYVDDLEKINAFSDALVAVAG